MEPTDTIVQLLEECRDEQERQVFTLAYVNHDVRVTPRSDPGAYPATITRNPIGYAIQYATQSGVTSSRFATPEQTAAKIHQIFGTAFLVRP